MLIRFFQILTIWSNAQLALITLCFTCFGILAGIYFYEDLLPYRYHLLAAFGIMAALVLLIWIRKMKQPEK